jgi:hypothetical protein
MKTELSDLLKGGTLKNHIYDTIAASQIGKVSKLIQNKFNNRVGVVHPKIRLIILQVQSLR